MTGQLPHWETNRDAICKRIRDTWSPFKVLLKIKNERILLPLWLDHYLSFLNPWEIIIADNESTDKSVINLYSKIDQRTVIFSYRGSVLGGFHNNIHDRKLFRPLYEAVSASCQHHIFVDCDEFLISAREMDWTKDRDIIHHRLSLLPSKAIATAWIDAVPESRNIVRTGRGEEQLIAALAWGKPILPAGVFCDGYLIHNGQFPEEIFSEGSDNAFILLHLKNYSREQRLLINREKLIARGIIDDSHDIADIATLDLSMCRDPTAVRLAREVGEMLNSAPSPPSDRISVDGVVFEDNGTIRFFGSEGREAFRSLVVEHGRLLAAGFELARRSLNPEPVMERSFQTVEGLLFEWKAATAASDYDRAEHVLRVGIERYPAELDEYQTPLFCKELVRLLLSGNRYNEAEEAVDAHGSYGAAGWHRILFARAYDRAGKRDAAYKQWRAFLSTHPGHPEAVAALGGIVSSRVSTPSPPPLADPAAPLPVRMTDPEREMFQGALQGVENFLEFGAGGSTALAAKSGVKCIVSVESDAGWLDLLATRGEIAAVDFTGLHIDIGPVGPWGMPSDLSTAPKWPRYHQEVWSKLPWQPDLVLVDGRFRVACSLAAVFNCSPDTRIVIHDFWNRPQYHLVLKYLDVLGRVETLGIFRAKRGFDLKDLVSDLIAHACDPA